MIEKRVLVTPDKHLPLHDDAALRATIELIKLVSPDIYVDLGDVAEFESVSHWRWRHKAKPPLEYQLPLIDRELREVNRHLDRIDEALDIAGTPEKYLTTGNHDDWINMFVDAHPYMAKDYSFPNAIRAAERGYTVLPLGKMLQIGDLHLYHGHYWSNMYHAKKHLERLGVNVMYAHQHSVQQHSLSQVQRTINAWSIGCLKDMTREANTWQRGRPNNWAHMNAVIEFLADGTFHVDLIEIKDGRATYWGNVIDGNPKAQVRVG